MKKIIISLLLLCPVVLFSQTNFKIKGKLSGANVALKKIYVVYNNGEVLIPTDSALVKSGEFEFEGIMKNQDSNPATLYLGNSYMSVKSDQQLSLFIKKGDQIILDIQQKLSSSKITGSPESEVYQLMKDSLAAMKNTDEILATLKTFIPKYPDSKMSFKLFFSRFGTGMAQVYPTRFAEISALFGMFSPRIQATKESLNYRKYLERIGRLAIGGTLPDFSAKTPEGKTIKLSDFRGKYVLVDFWASWCIPCRAEFPFLRKAYQKFKNKNFEILGYSLDNDKSLWISSMENDDVPWLNMSNLIGSNDPIAVEYQVHAIPANFLIDPSGKVIAVNLRGELLEPKLEQLIK